MAHSLRCAYSCNNASDLCFMKTALRTVRHAGSAGFIWHRVILNLNFFSSHSSSASSDLGPTLATSSPVRASGWSSVSIEYLFILMRCISWFQLWVVNVHIHMKKNIITLLVTVTIIVITVSKHGVWCLKNH